jgi:hypothetical protein
VECGCRLESNESDWNTGTAWNRRTPNRGLARINSTYDRIKR